jgi:hypothetical protein
MQSHNTRPQSPFQFDGKTVLYALVCALGPYVSAALLVLLWQF